MTTKAAIELYQQVFTSFGMEDEKPEGEICPLLNIGILQVMRDYFFPDAGRKDQGVIFGEHEFIDQDFAKLIIPPFNVIPDGQGRVFIDDINQSFLDNVVRDQTGEISSGKVDIFKLHVGGAKGAKPSSHISHDQIFNWADNVFTAPDDNNLYHAWEDGYIQVYPNNGEQRRLSIITYHPYIWYDPANADVTVDPVITDRVMILAIFRAIKLTGVNIRDRDLYQFAQTELNDN